MKLYLILFTHYSPKDSKNGIETYLITRDDEHVYEWMKSQPKLKNGEYLFNHYKDSENDDSNFKQKMIDLKGEYFDPHLELSDLYYGKTVYGWQEIEKDFSNENMIDVFNDLNSYVNVEIYLPK